MAYIHHSRDFSPVQSFPGLVFYDHLLLSACNIKFKGTNMVGKGENWAGKATPVFDGQMTKKVWDDNALIHFIWPQQYMILPHCFLLS